jgi:hypothetical protein
MDQQRQPPQVSAPTTAKAPAAKAPNVAGTVAEIKNLLSYGLTDWVVTDAEVERATKLLGSLPRDLQGKVLMELGPDMRERLVANLAEVEGDDLGAVLGSMDLGVVRALPEAQQLDLLEKLGAGGTILDPKQLTLLQRWFDATPDGNTKLLARILGIRFGAEVRAMKDERNYDPIEWGAKGLRRTWSVLATLPAGHVRGNEMLDVLARFLGEKRDEKSYTHPAGFQRNQGGVVALAYSEDHLDAPLEAGRDEAKTGQPSFDQAVRHEIGHAVDDVVNASDKYCPTAAGGAWIVHGPPTMALLKEMIGRTEGALKGIPSEWVDRIADALVAAMKTGNNVAARGKVHELYMRARGADGKGPDLGAIFADPVFLAIEAGANHGWDKPNGGVPLGGRIYQCSYENHWTSYAAEARARMVSTYQYRAPGEWFAEAYATYFSPNQKTPGALLAKVDPKTKSWMDGVVKKL